MTTIRLRWTCALLAVLAVGEARAADSTDFRVGAADKDITPPAGIPMWGYGARHDMLSEGTLDPLMAKAIVIAAGDDKVALVGIDIGRGPTEAMMKIIREEIAAKAGIRHVLITGSHTHHGPVIELTDEPGFGQGKFDVAVEYTKKLPQLADRCHPRGRQEREARQARRRDRNGDLESKPPHQARAQSAPTRSSPCSGSTTCPTSRSRSWSTSPPTRS